MYPHSGPAGLSPPKLPILAPHQQRDEPALGTGNGAGQAHQRGPLGLQEDSRAAVFGPAPGAAAPQRQKVLMLSCYPLVSLEASPSLKNFN